MKKFGQYDIIYNTVPSMILHEERLKLLNKETIIIDLASKPGGVDFKKAEELGLNARLELSLPGKIAPITSAEYIMSQWGQSPIDKMSNSGHI